MPRAGLAVGRLVSALGRGERLPSGGLAEKGGRVRKQMGNKVICNASVVRNRMSGAEGGISVSFDNLFVHRPSVQGTCRVVKAGHMRGIQCHSSSQHPQLRLCLLQVVAPGKTVQRGPDVAKRSLLTTGLPLK